MRNQAEVQNVRAECSGYGSLFGFMVAGLGIGAALSVFFAPRSGEETRRWIANKCLDAAEIANARVHDARLRIHEVVDRGQERVTAEIAARRQEFAEAEGAAQAQAV
jgi:gas vesicle protein